VHQVGNQYIVIG